VNAPSGRRNECGTLADPEGKAVDGSELGALRREPPAAEQVDIHEEPVEEHIGRA
jgi:hypothetical protein